MSGRHAIVRAAVRGSITHQLRSAAGGLLPPGPREIGTAPDGVPVFCIPDRKAFTLAHANKTSKQQGADKQQATGQTTGPGCRSTPGGAAASQATRATTTETAAAKDAFTHTLGFTRNLAAYTLSDCGDVCDATFCTNGQTVHELHRDAYSGHIPVQHPAASVVHTQRGCGIAGPIRTDLRLCVEKPIVRAGVVDYKPVERNVRVPRTVHTVQRSRAYRLG